MVYLFNFNNSFPGHHVLSAQYMVTYFMAVCLTLEF